MATPTAKKRKNEKKVIESEIIVTRTYLGQKTEKRKKVAVHAFVTDPAYISKKNGMTIDMGNFEYARIDVFLSLPCYVEEIADAWKTCKEWVDTTMSEEMDELVDKEK